MIGPCLRCLTPLTMPPYSTYCPDCQAILSPVPTREEIKAWITADPATMERIAMAKAS